AARAARLAPGVLGVGLARLAAGAGEAEHAADEHGAAGLRHRLHLAAGAAAHLPAGVLVLCGQPLPAVAVETDAHGVFSAGVLGSGLVRDHRSPPLPLADLRLDRLDRLEHVGAVNDEGHRYHAVALPGFDLIE